MERREERHVEWRTDQRPLTNTVRGDWLIIHVVSPAFTDQRLLAVGHRCSWDLWGRETSGARWATVAEPSTFYIKLHPSLQGWASEQAANLHKSMSMSSCHGIQGKLDKPHGNSCHEDRWGPKTSSSHFYVQCSQQSCHQDSRIGIQASAPLQIHTICQQDLEPSYA